jgi:hypothetical protein
MSAIEPEFVYVVVDFDGAIIGAGISPGKAKHHAASYLGVTRASLPDGLDVLKIKRQLLKKRLSDMGMDECVKPLLFLE